LVAQAVETLDHGDFIEVRAELKAGFCGRVVDMAGRAKWGTLAMLLALRLGLSSAFGGPRDGGGPANDERPPCGTLEVCLAQLDARSADPANFEIDQFDQALAKAIRLDGKAAVPHLLRVLAGPDSKARDVAAYTLCDIDGLTAADTPALLRALAAGEDWIAPAVARIGSPEAITALFAALKARPDENKALAFKQLGRKGVPILLNAFDCRAGSPSDVSGHPDGCWDQFALDAVSDIFGKLGPEASDAVAPLTEIARDRKRPRVFRAEAVQSLGEIGESAASAAPSLRQIARAEPKTFRRLVETALAAMQRRPPADGGARGTKAAPITSLDPLPELGGKLVFAGAIVDLASGKFDRRRPLEGTADVGELSPDGASLALVSCLQPYNQCGASGERQIELLDLKSGKSQALARSSTQIFPSFSPDGALLLLDVLGLGKLASRGYVIDPKRRLLWALPFAASAWSARCDRFIEARDFGDIAGMDFVTSDLNGRHVRRLGPPSGLHALAVELSPDESKIAYTGPGVDPWVIDLKSGRRRRLVRTPEVTEKVAIWSPDGRWLATWIMTSAFDDSQLWAWNLASGHHIVFPFAGLDEFAQISSPRSWWAPAPPREVRCARRLEAARGNGQAAIFPLRLEAAEPIN